MPRNLIWAALFSLFAIVTAAPGAKAASAHEIDVGVNETLDRFFYKIGGHASSRTSRSGFSCSPRS